ncbi:hypothetical protein KIM372_16750 [Bombiscardovia nodaiensis]|uniref:Uncharacterized protein n=1 Tax=Bombiscardovia nodaiensis TaxID=2932181 RepID=A0ABN6SDT8_9BIFI|nr:hypothetical protein KIM372_16750 [Bombiscardovia nodaiensis]
MVALAAVSQPESAAALGIGHTSDEQAQTIRRARSQRASQEQTGQAAQPPPKLQARGQLEPRIQTPPVCNFGTSTFAQCFPNAQLASTLSGGNVNAVVTQAYAQSVTHLDFTAYGLTDINGMQIFTNLVGIYLSNNQIPDMSPLANLPKLDYLVAFGAGFEEIPVLNLPSLTDLDLRVNGFTSMANLATSNLPKLETLQLDVNYLTAITPLNIPTLTALSMDTNKISDLTPLVSSSFPNLTYLNVGYNKLDQVGPLANVNFPKLDSLYINNNQITDITPVVGHFADTFARLKNFDASDQEKQLPAVVDPVPPYTLGPATVNSVLTPALYATGSNFTPADNASFDATSGKVSWTSTVSGPHSYAFAYTGTTPGGLSYPFNGTITQGVTITKAWVTFDGNGGQPARSLVSVTIGSAVGEPAAPRREGWAFAGWFSDPTNGSQWNFSQPVTQNMTLYAHWAPLMVLPKSGALPRQRLLGLSLCTFALIAALACAARARRIRR